MYLLMLCEVLGRDKLVAFGALAGLPLGLLAWRPLGDGFSERPVLSLVQGAVRELLFAEGTVVGFVLAHGSDYVMLYRRRPTLNFTCLRMDIRAHFIIK